MHELIQPREWVCVKFPSDQTRIVQIIPNTTLSLGKYGSFPANLLVERPFHATFEVLEPRDGEDFCRLRIVPAAEVHADMLAQPAPPEEGGGSSTPSTQGATEGVAAEAQVEVEAEVQVEETEGTGTTADPDVVVSPSGGGGGGGDDAVEGAANPSITLLDPATGAVLGRSDVRTLVSGDEGARQLLTTDEIEALKKGGAGAGRDLVTRLMLSHTGLDRKTRFSVAKYKLHKFKKYLRRFSVLPLDAATLAHWLLVEREPARVLEMREEALALVGCWANVHFAEAAPGDTGKRLESLADEHRGAEAVAEMEEEEDEAEEGKQTTAQGGGGKWLVVDETGGLLIAAMAERMGILLHAEQLPKEREGDGSETEKRQEETAADVDVEFGNATACRPPDDPPSESREARKPVPPPPPQASAKREDGAGVDAPQHLNDDMRPTNRVPQDDEHEQEQEHEQEHEHEPSSTTPPARRPQQQQFRQQALLPQTNTLTLVHTNTQPNLHCLKYFGYDAANPHPKPPLHPLCSHLHSLSWLQLLDPAADPLLASPPELASPSEVATWKTSRRSNYHRKHRRWARTAQVSAAARAGGFSVDVYVESFVW